MVEPLSDRSKFWTASPDWATAEIRRDDWRARPVLGLGQVLVSGRIAGAVEALAPGASEVGLWGIVAGNPHVVRIARDRALIVSAEPLTVEPGWRDGWAATPADDVYAALEIDGSGLAALVAEATAADLDAGSRLGRSHVRRHSLPALPDRPDDRAAACRTAARDLHLALAGKAWVEVRVLAKLPLIRLPAPSPRRNGEKFVGRSAGTSFRDVDGWRNHQ